MCITHLTSKIGTNTDLNISVMFIILRIYFLSQYFITVNDILQSDLSTQFRTRSKYLHNFQLAHEYVGNIFICICLSNKSYYMGNDAEW